MSIVTGTDFIYLPTRDFERAVEFYGTTLGLHCSARYGKRPGAEFETGNLTLAVIAVEGFGMTFHVNEPERLRSAARETFRQNRVLASSFSTSGGW